MEGRILIDGIYVPHPVPKTAPSTIHGETSTHLVPKTAPNPFFFDQLNQKLPPELRYQISGELSNDDLLALLVTCQSSRKAFGNPEYLWLRVKAMYPRAKEVRDLVESGGYQPAEDTDRHDMIVMLAKISFRYQRLRTVTYDHRNFKQATDFHHMPVKIEPSRTWGRYFEVGEKQFELDHEDLPFDCNEGIVVYLAPSGKLRLGGVAPWQNCRVPFATRKCRLKCVRLFNRILMIEWARKNDSIIPNRPQRESFFSMYSLEISQSATTGAPEITFSRLSHFKLTMRDWNDCGPREVSYSVLGSNYCAFYAWLANEPREERLDVWKYERSDPVRAQQVYSLDTSRLRQMGINQGISPTLRFFKMNSNGDVYFVEQRSKWLRGLDVQIPAPNGPDVPDVEERVVTVSLDTQGQPHAQIAAGWYDASGVRINHDFANYVGTAGKIDLLTPWGTYPPYSAENEIYRLGSRFTIEPEGALPGIVEVTLLDPAADIRLLQRRYIERMYHDTDFCLTGSDWCAKFNEDLEFEDNMVKGDEFGFAAWVLRDRQEWDIVDDQSIRLLQFQSHTYI
ncbi:MAG: hypothetical protein Q9204_001285 [Flavoplaca sp. TL-2023a]